MVVSIVLFVSLFFGAVLSAKQKMIYSNDQGYPGCDGDNPQVLVHFLYYSNDIDIQLLIATGSTNCKINNTNGSNIIEMNNILSLYEKDYPLLNKSSVENGGNPYPTYDTLSSMALQGCNSSSPPEGYPPYPLEASNRIIQIVDSLAEDEYVWYGAGAGLCELARALHDKPSIASKIKLYLIGDFNDKRDPYSRYYVFNNFPELWFVESNTTLKGWYEGGNQTGIYNGTTYVSEVISKSGNLGAYYATILPADYPVPTFKEGDGPCYFYVIDPDHSNRDLFDPTLPNWGGQYQLYYPNRTIYWGDYKNSTEAGRETISQFRVDYLNDWMKRLQWLY